MTLTLACPAKLNLFLHILRKRADGYHELQTAFQILDYGDELEIESNTSEEIELDDLPGLPKQDNLIFKAAELLRAHTGCREGAKLSLHKRLPMGGGIGGGSSNAATALIGLNTLWNLGLSIDTLAELGRQLGADVPVFVRGRSAWAEGVGEKLQALDLAPRWYLVLSPRCHVSTALIFSHKDLTRDSANITVAAFLAGAGKNDCQALVESLFPEVKKAVEWLSQFGVARMTGTGACVFAAFDSQEIANEVLAKRPKDLDGFVARGVNVSPLHQSLSI